MEVEANMKIIDKGSLIAVGDVIIDKKLVIHQVKVLNLKDSENNYKMAVYMPRKKTKDGWSKSIVIHNQELQEEIDKKVIQSVQEELSKDFGEYPIDVQIIPFTGSGKLRAYANVVYAEVIEIKGIQIWKEQGLLKIVWPFTVVDEEYQSIVDTSTKYVRAAFNKMIAKSYNEMFYSEEIQRGQQKEFSGGKCL